MGEHKIVIGENSYLPRYSQPDSRSRYKNAIEYDKKGNIQAIYLENISKIKTPLGDINAEFITFYPSSHLHRIFPVYGQLSGFWSEEEEKELLTDTTVIIGDKTYTGKFSCVCLYDSGNVKSITIWPNEIIEIKVQSQTIKVRNGISFYEDGNVKSLEPSVPVVVQHKIGNYIAYDPFAVGISGDYNSLCYYKEGNIKKLTTIITGVMCTSREDNTTYMLRAELMPSPYDIEEEVLIPVIFEFTEEGIIFTDSNKVCHTYTYARYQFKVLQISENLPYMTCGNCNSCNKCKK